MVRTVVLTIMGSLLLAASAGAATDGVTPLRAKISDRFFSVASGSDIFWMSDRKTKPEPKFGYSSTTSLWRTSFLDGSKTLLKRFDPNDTATGIPEELLAGGGYVYVNMLGDGDNGALDSSTTVVRMARDGSGFQKIATGTVSSGEEDSILVEQGKGHLNDCGTSVEAELATSDGSVLIRETTADRESKPCGGKKNVDHDRVYLLSPSGATKEVLREDVPLTRKIKVHKDGGYEGSSGRKPGSGSSVVSIAGDLALIARGKGPGYFVRDLNTGAETGPYKASIKGSYPFTFGSFDPFGRVAVSAIAFSGTRKHVRVHVASGLYRPGDTASYTPVKGRSIIVFCGTHLIALTGKGARELDPVTLNLIRPVAPAHKDGSSVFLDNQCNGDYLYMSKSRGKGATYLAYPLG